MLCAIRDIDAESKGAFEEVLEESREAARLLEDMLVLARADEGHADVVFETLNLPELMDEVCEKVRPLAEAKQQILIVSGKNRPARISGDRSSLRRLLWTLLDNAVRASIENLVE